MTEFGDVAADWLPLIVWGVALLYFLSRGKLGPSLAAFLAVLVESLPAGIRPFGRTAEVMLTLLFILLQVFYEYLIAPRQETE